MYKKLAIIGLAFLGLDQLIKLIITNTMVVNTQIEVIPDFFYLANVHNYGGAWSIMNGNVFFLIIVGLLAPVFIYFSFIKGKELKNLEIVIYGILFGGIMGNLIDRIVNGYVVDYFSFNIFEYNFPVFNLADMGIVIPIGFVLFWTIKEDIVCKKLESKKK